MMEEESTTEVLYEYYNTRTLDKNKREPRYNYMTWTQKLEVVRDTNEVALLLLEFYYSKAGYTEYTYKDEQVARGLNWTARKVRDNRSKLEQNGYFSRLVTTARKGKATIQVQNVELGNIRWKEK